MKFRTVVLFALAFLAVWVFYAFFQSENNARILTSYFSLWGFSIKVLHGLLGAMLVAAIIPATYFSVKYLQLGKENKSLHKDIAQAAAEMSANNQISSLLDHGRYDLLLERIADKQDAASNLLKGKAHLYSHRAAQAIEPLRKAFFEGGIIEAGYLLAKANRANGQSAIPVLEALIQRDSQNAHRAYRLLLEAQDKQGLWAECLQTALTMKKTGLPVDDMDGVGYQFEAIHAQSDQPPKKRVERYQQLLQTAPEFVAAFLAISDCYFEMNMPEKALATWESGFSQTQNPVFLEHLERYYLEQGRPEEAIQIYREILVRDDRPMLRYRLARLYLKLEMLDDSLQNYGMLQAHLSDVPGFSAQLGDIYARRGLFQEAYRALAQPDVTALSAADSHVCRSCGQRYEAWQSRCNHCRQWNQIILEVATVAVEPVPTAPLYY